MKAIILAAGKGIRMLPLTYEIPKALIKIKDKPIIDHIFEALPSDISEVIVVVKHLDHKIKEYLGEEFKGRKVFFAEGSEKGTAYSLLAARPFIGNGRFLFIYGDELINSQDVINCLKNELAVVVFNSTNPSVHGIGTFRSDGTLEELIEKPKDPKTNVAIDGIMVLNEKIFDYQPRANDKGEYYLTSMLDQFVKDYRVWPVPSVKFIGDVTTPEDIKRVEKLIG